MPILIAVATLIQLGCAYHAFSSGRGLIWVIFILAVPVVGWGSYLIAEAIEYTKIISSLEKNAADVFSGPDSSVDLKKLRADVEEFDTVYNRELLAEGLLKHDEFDSAIEQFEKCLSMGHGSNPKNLLHLSWAYFLSEKHVQARAALERLIQENPDYEPRRRDWLMARTLQKLGDLEGALQHFKRLGDWPGEEVEYRKALLLKKMERAEEARRAFEGILKRAELFTHTEKFRERRWIDLAKKQLSQ
ncbi:MAG TPA: hypothetical protein DCM05_03620 [Elusimicrobia bacterium]|nr:hypothetical protein [Elusimicrobiota bacterium]